MKILGTIIFNHKMNIFKIYNGNVEIDTKDVNLGNEQLGDGNLQVKNQLKEHMNEKIVPQSSG